jgi:hypothetical protein
MKPLSEHLTTLILMAEDVIRRPNQLLARLPAAFEELAAEIRHADQKPAESVRTTRAAVIMVTAIEAFFVEPKTDHHWQMVIGAMLPLLRIDAFRAFENEREARRS